MDRSEKEFIESSTTSSDSIDLSQFKPQADNPQPGIIQFFATLRQAVLQGRWKPNQALPTVEEFAAQVQLPALEVHLALSLLNSQHWIRQGPEGLFFATPRLDQPIGKLSSFSEMLKERGFNPASTWIERAICAPSLDEQWRLQLKVGEKIARLQRLRMADGIVIGYEVSAMPERLVPNPLAIEDSLYQYFREQNLAIDFANEEIDADYADEVMARWCNFKPGQPLLRLTRVSYLVDRVPLELSYSFFRSDYYHYVVQYKD